MSATEERLGYLRERKLGDCSRCPLHRHRTRVVFGEGNPDADVMFVGEAPGAREDKTGRPFVGAAGKLLDEWLRELGKARADVYIANTVKCRPFGNRDPYPQEKEACAPFLHTQIFLIRPKVLIALGRHAANTLSGKLLTMNALREEVLEYWNEATGQRVPVVAIYHPSYVLRRGRGEAQQTAVADLQRAFELAP